MKRVLEAGRAIELKGFNNLTKSLRINLYLFRELLTERDQQSFIADVQHLYGAEALQKILHSIADRIEAEVIGVSTQDYQPWGSSALMLLSDAGPLSVQMHLNKSHLCAHTYPDVDHDGRFACLRLDLDLASCGTISPLRALDHVLEHFQPEAVQVDYAVRGFTRDHAGHLLFMDHPMVAISDGIAPMILQKYQTWTGGQATENFWNLKMLRNISIENSPRDAILLDQLKKILQVP